MPLVHTFRNVFGSPKTSRLLANCFYFVRSFCFCHYPSNYELNVVTFSSSFRHFVLLRFRDLPVNRFNFNFLLLILTHCTQFQLVALNSTFSAVSGFLFTFSQPMSVLKFLHTFYHEKQMLPCKMGERKLKHP